MGLSQSYNRAIQKQLANYAAWLPFVNTFEMGEFGVFENGVFHSMGNIKRKYPDINIIEQESPAASLDFASAGTKTFKLDAGGNILNSFAGLGGIEARLKFVFESADSCLIKVKEMKLREMKNMEEVAKALAKKPDWRSKFCIVWKVYTGVDGMVICTKEAGSEIELTASADILQQVEVGKVEVSPAFSSSRESALSEIGQTGVLALGLFKLRWLNGQPNILRDGSPGAVEIETLSGTQEDSY